MFNRLRILVAAAVLAATPAVSSAQLVSGQWYGFNFLGVGSFGTECPECSGAEFIPAPSLWTYTSATGGTITFLDGYLSGDQFKIYNFASVMGSTSASSTGSNCNGPTDCLANSAMSRGTFAFGAGDHSFSAEVLASPYNSGGAFFRIDDGVSTVPEPSTYAMMGVGLAALAFARRRRKA
jgi:hypothetical protein